MHITRVTLMKALAFSNNQLPQISYMVYIHKKKRTTFGISGTLYM